MTRQSLSTLNLAERNSVGIHVQPFGSWFKSNVDPPPLSAAHFESPRLLNKIHEFRLPVRARVEIRGQYRKSLANSSQRHPTVFVIELCYRGPDKMCRRLRRLDHRSTSRFRFSPAGLLSLGQQILRVYEAPTSSAKAFRSLLRAKAVYIDA